MLLSERSIPRRSASSRSALREDVLPDHGQEGGTSWLWRGNGDVVPHEDTPAAWRIVSFGWSKPGAR
jgi:hypothetical protein